MIATLDMLNAICGNDNHEDRKLAFLYRLYDEGRPFGMDAPEVVAQIIPQVAHESGRFRYVREVWGPTPAQRRYEGRADLGNTIKGDGKLFMGRDLIQNTGRANYRALTKWLRSRIGPTAPDFEAKPELLEQPAWLGISVVWYFAKTVRKGRHILEMCRDGDVEAVSRAVNGGTNGLADRLDLYTRTALVMLGHGPTDIREFQSANALHVDGVAGPATRKALHMALKSQQPAKIAPPVRNSAPDGSTPPKPKSGVLAWLSAIIFALIGRPKGN